MLYNFDQFVHNSLGLCFWDLPALLVAVIAVVVFVMHRHNQKKRAKDFKKDLKNKIRDIQETPEAGYTE